MVTLIELLIIFPLRVASDVLVSVAVLAALYYDDHILVVLITVHDLSYISCNKLVHKMKNNDNDGFKIQSLGSL